MWYCWRDCQGGVDKSDFRRPTAELLVSAFGKWNWFAYASAANKQLRGWWSCVGGWRKFPKITSESSPGFSKTKRFEKAYRRSGETCSRSVSTEPHLRRDLLKYSANCISISSSISMWKASLKVNISNRLPLSTCVLAWVAKGSDVGLYISLY